jgi:hypothetical protein
VAGSLVRRDADEHIDALKLVVGDYIATRDDDDEVDWGFIAKRNMRKKVVWASEDKKRHQHAMKKLKASGYVIASKRRA